jgi:hypothetical protein
VVDNLVFFFFFFFFIISKKILLKKHKAPLSIQEVYTGTTHLAHK